MTFDELALGILRELIPNSGARDWSNEETKAKLTLAACEMAATILYYSGAIGMATKTLLTPMDGTPKQICFRDATDFNPAIDLRVTSDGSFDTACQIILAALANAAGRQSVKVDLGAHWAEVYQVRAAFEIAATPTAGNMIELYWAPSQDPTAGDGNPALILGTDAAYAGYSANLASSVLQLQFIGAFCCTVQASAVVQVGIVGKFKPAHRYGSLVVVNNSGAALHSDDVEIHVVFDPIVNEFQSA